MDKKQQPDNRRTIAGQSAQIFTEDRIQQDIFLHANNHFCLAGSSPRGIIFHVPNENQYKRTGIGVKAGVSDLIFIYKGKCLFIEVKTPTGKQAPKQAEFQSRVEANGFKYYLVRSLEDFKKVMDLEFTVNTLDKFKTKDGIIPEHFAG